MANRANVYSNKFRQMQELTNDYYSEIKLHNIFHIAYKAIAFSTNKKEATFDGSTSRRCTAIVTNERRARLRHSVKFLVRFAFET